MRTRWRRRAGRDLPTEAEWEFAARGGKAPSAEDDQPTADIGPDGRYRGNTWQGLFPMVNEGKDGYVGLAPAGCLAPNGYGLHDMTGNVWEWTSSYYRTDHRDAAADSFDDPRQPGIPVRVMAAPISVRATSAGGTVRRRGRHRMSGSAVTVARMPGPHAE